MVSYVCLSSKKKKISPHLFHSKRRGKRETSAEFLFRCRGFSPNTAPSQPVSIGSKIDISLPTAAVRSGPTATIFLKFSREKGRRCRPLRQVFALGIPFQIIRLERGQTLVFCRRLYLENKAVSCSGFPGPCAGVAHAQRAPRDSASHHARLDVLVGDLLVVVGAAAGGVHRRGRHGVEREDKLLSVTHAG